MNTDILEILRETVNYQTILQMKDKFNRGRLKGEKKLTIKDFIVLSSGNDPFYAKAPRGELWGQWFAEQWREHKGHEARVHVRGLHYALVGRASSETPVYMPDGKVYENTEKCWKKLEQAGKYARYNGYIDVEKFEDRRAQSLYMKEYAEPKSSIGIYDTTSYYEIDFPDFPRFPFYTYDFKNRQRYRLEVWCEKSTQETVLMPIADRYEVTMLSAQGELSISAMLKAIRRAEVMPTRILYISDFDPAGRSMPVAASRKLEFLQGLLNSSADIQLYPIALTHEQCVTYQLERTPIKDSEKRKAGFEDRYGGGATELDALEAKHPGELAQLLEREIIKFVDDDLPERTREEEKQLEDAGEVIQDEISDEYDTDALRVRYDELRAEFDEWKAEKWDPFLEDLTSTYQGILDEMDERKPDIDAYPLPEGREVPVLDGCLYDSTRDYLQQIAAYSAFTGKFSHLIQEDDEEDIA